LIKGIFKNHALILEMLFLTFIQRNLITAIRESLYALRLFLLKAFRQSEQQIKINSLPKAAGFSPE